MLGELDVFHVGLVVEDIEASMATIGGNLAIRWAPVQTRTQVITTGAGEVRHEPIIFTYSCDGPPHVELIQSQPGSAWEVTPPGVLHHIGAFAQDVTKPPGSGLELEFGGGDGPQPVGFAYYRAPGGIRVELVDALRREVFAAWFAGGALTAANANPS